MDLWTKFYQFWSKHVDKTPPQKKLRKKKEWVGQTNASMILIHPLNKEAIGGARLALPAHLGNHKKMLH